MTFFSNLISDLREAKAAAESHNVSNYEPPSASSPTPGEPVDGDSKNTSTTDKPSSSSAASTATAKPAPGPTGASPVPTDTQKTYVPPPPPPKNLPHGWTARYDAKEGKFSYSYGVDSKSEQWDFPTEKTK